MGLLEVIVELLLQAMIALSQQRENEVSKSSASTEERCEFCVFKEETY